jgi:hypothetical protein
MRARQGYRFGWIESITTKSDICGREYGRLRVGVLQVRAGRADLIDPRSETNSS